MVIVLSACGSSSSSSVGKYTLTVSPSPASGGETVTITFTNNSGSTVAFPSTSPWTVADSSEANVYSPIGATVMVDLPSGDSEAWSWNQADNNGSQAPNGRYVISVIYYEGDELKSIDASLEIS